MEGGVTTRQRSLLSRLIVACVSASLLAPAPIPRPSPELKFLSPSGGEFSLSSFKGKVVLIEFLLTNCPHCVRVAPTIDKLYGELGPRGFQPLGIAFDPGISGQAVTNFVRLFKVSYPVGFTTSNNVDSFLGRAAVERFQVPQIVVIDRAGVIRVQSPAKGDPNLEREGPLRNLINSLL
jgi:thiol-disulfide isomerase/thioredoxin